MGCEIFFVRIPLAGDSVSSRCDPQVAGELIQIQILYFLMPYDTSDNIYTNIHKRGKKWASDIRINWAIDIFY